VVSGISWHWILLDHVPIGLALMPLAATRLLESFGPRPRLDLPGLVLAATAALAVTWGWCGAAASAGQRRGARLDRRRAGARRRLSPGSGAPLEPMLPLGLFATAPSPAPNAVSFSSTRPSSGALPDGAVLPELPRLLPLSRRAAARLSMPRDVHAPIAGLARDRYGNRPFMGPRPRPAGGRPRLGGAHRSPTVSYPEVGIALLIAGTGTSFCFPTSPNADHGLFAAVGGRRRRWRQEHPARARRRLRRLGPGQRLRWAAPSSPRPTPSSPASRRALVAVASSWECWRRLLTRRAPGRGAVWRRRRSPSPSPSGT